MKYHSGWAFPDADVFMTREMKADGTYQLSHLELALKSVKAFGCAIDGGAHVGTWSRVLSQRFAEVIAVEPSRDTFDALVANLTAFGCSNVQAKNVAVGSAPGLVTMRLDADNEARANTGARFVKQGGSIPVETIDSWSLPVLDFLKLDIEGSEVVALQGAAQTITRCRPVILFENKWLWSRHFGYPKDAVAKLLTSFGYRFEAQASCDQIWVPA